MRFCCFSHTAGVERNLQEVEAIKEVFAFFSSDRFERGTPLTRVLDPFATRLFKTQDGLRLRSGESGELASVVRAENGRVVRWVGTRMLPPCQEPLQVVYQVNGQLVAARDQSQQRLRAPKRLVLEGSAKGTTAGFDKVNLVSASLSVAERFARGVPVALCVFEDPKRRGEALVKPRTIAEQRVHQRPPWIFGTSSFGAYPVDCSALARQCFEHDWARSKLPSLIAHRSQEMLQVAIRDRYAQLMAAYNAFAFAPFWSSRGAPSLLLNSFTEVLKVYTDDFKLLFKGRQDLRLADVDTIYLVSNMMQAPREKRRQLVGLPENGLARFQFLEAIVRIAVKCFFASGAEEPVEAFEAFMNETNFGAAQLERRKKVHAAMFSEECCLVCREFDNTLKRTFDRYKNMSRYFGSKASATVSFGAWMQLMSDALVADVTGTSRREMAIAFAHGRGDRVDDLSTFGALELSFPEFLVALGALAWQINDTEPVCFADEFAQFIEDSLEPLFGRRNSLLRAMEGGGGDELVSQFVTRVFAHASVGPGGSLKQREFLAFFVDAEAGDDIRRLGLDLGAGELKMLFRHLDHDHSGEVSFQELSAGLGRLRAQMRGLSRSIVQLRRLFAEVDRDGSGSLDIGEFGAMLRSDGAQARLQHLGLSVTDAEELWDEISSGGGVGVTLDDVFGAMLRIRDPRGPAVRGLSILAEAFLLADVQGTGFLTRREVVAVFGKERVLSRLTKLRLPVPDWAKVFDELDSDHDGGLSWAELRQGAEALWSGIDLDEESAHVQPSRDSVRVRVGSKR
eukprot:TRINITY_DN20688_c0_g5_i2.p1 TRINITY_DN20688_c0_g5~~TRINITY_DN20688_c0_g5_i2.p1  ORF type:complete len:794 (+),score=180.94 TRINITY_DN20688_c0_g5_i2:896-3277(+)